MKTRMFNQNDAVELEQVIAKTLKISNNWDYSKEAFWHHLKFFENA